MPELKVRFTRGKDKKDVLSVTRKDGSQSWQHQQPGIPVHDLTHFAVESALHLENGFYGLLAQGWDIWRPHEVMVQYKDSIRVTHTP